MSTSIPVRDNACGNPEEPGVRWTIPGHYGTYSVHDSFREAVVIARHRQQEYLASRPDPIPDGIRAFVALRVATTLGDSEVVRFEVFPDHVEKLEN